jgi:hypothetical protein
MQKLTLFPYYGGKSYLLKHILNLIPYENITCYIEPYFGAGNVFFNKKPHKVEIINDIDLNIYNLLKTLQDEILSQKFLHKIQYTTYHEQIFHDALQPTPNTSRQKFHTKPRIRLRLLYPNQYVLPLYGKTPIRIFTNQKRRKRIPQQNTKTQPNHTTTKKRHHPQQRRTRNHPTKQLPRYTLLHRPTIPQIYTRILQYLYTRN